MDDCDLYLEQGKDNKELTDKMASNLFSRAAQWFKYENQAIRNAIVFK